MCEREHLPSRGAMALETEIAFFEAQRAAFLKEHRGKYALIKGEECFGFFDDAQRAFEAGVARFGAEPVLIKQVLDKDQIDVTPALCYGLLHATT